MARVDDGFESVIGTLFSDDEQRGMVDQLDMFSLEPAHPDREGLLADFDGFLGVLIGVSDPTVIRAHRERFLGDTCLKLDIQPKEPIRIAHVGSYVTNLVAEDQEWAVINGIGDVFGDFDGLSIGPWYDVPLLGEEPADIKPYLRKHGLFVAVTGARVVYPSIEEVQLLGGRTLVPLNHGAPDLYHVVR